MAAKTSNKRAWIIAIVLVVIIAIVAVLATIFLANKPEKTIEATFTALKEGNMDILNNYSITGGTDTSLENELTSELTGSSDVENELMASLFTQLDWQIKETKKDGDTAVVTVDITNKDFSNVMQEVFQEIIAKAFSSAFSDEEMSDEDVINLMKEKIEEVTSTTTNTTEINMIKEDGIWKFSNSEELVNTLLPGFAAGLENAQNSFSESFGIDTENDDSGL